MSKGDVVSLQVRMSKGLHRELKRRAKQNKCSLNATVVEAIKSQSPKASPHQIAPEGAIPLREMTNLAWIGYKGPRFKPEPKVVSVSDAATVLSLSKRTVERLVANGVFKTIKLSARRIGILREDVQHYLIRDLIALDTHLGKSDTTRDIFTRN